MSRDIRGDVVEPCRNDASQQRSGLPEHGACGLDLVERGAIDGEDTRGPQRPASGGDTLQTASANSAGSPAL